MNIYERALREWGVDSQFDMVIEECSELIQAIIKLRRGKVGKEAVIEECVDVELTINQMKVFFCGDMETWDKIRMAKIERITKLIDKCAGGIKECPCSTSEEVKG